MDFEKLQESKVFGFFDWVYRLFILNLITILFFLPVITALPGIVATYATLRDHLDGDITNTFKLYFRNFKKYFERSFTVWIVIVIAAAIGGYSIFFYGGLNKENILSQAGFYVMVFMILIIFIILVNLPLLIINFKKLEGVDLLKASTYVSFKFLGTTLVLLGLLIVTIITFPFLPYSLLVGVTLPIFIALKVTRPVYRYLTHIKFDERMTIEIEEDEDENETRN